MALTKDALAQIFSGMDLGAEKIQENFSKLLQETLEQDNTIATIFPFHSVMLSGNQNGVFDNTDWNNLKQGIYRFGWWTADQVPAHSFGDPAANKTIQEKMTGNWGTLLAIGNPTGKGSSVCTQLAMCAGGALYLRDNTGTTGEFNQWNQFVYTNR